MDGKVLAIIGLFFVCMIFLSCSVASVALSSSSSSGSTPAPGSTQAPGLLGGLLGGSTPAQTSSTPGPFSISDYFSDSVASPAWCRVQGGGAYTGYRYITDVGDANACKKICIADPKCKAVEADGKHCWFYSGEEYSQPAPATEAGHACYKVKSRPAQSVYDASFSDSAAKPAWCRVQGGGAYTGYSMVPGDTNFCKSTCWADAKCKAVETDGKNCWYYNGAEYSQPAPAAEVDHLCFKKK